MIATGPVRIIRYCVHKIAQFPGNASVSRSKARIAVRRNVGQENKSAVYWVPSFEGTFCQVLPRSSEYMIPATPPWARNPVHEVPGFVGGEVVVIVDGDVKSIAYG